MTALDDVGIRTSAHVGALDQSRHASEMPTNADDGRDALPDHAGPGIDAHVGAACIGADDASVRGDDFDNALRWLRSAFRSGL